MPAAVLRIYPRDNCLPCCKRINGILVYLKYSERWESAQAMLLALQRLQSKVGPELGTAGPLEQVRSRPPPGGHMRGSVTWGGLILSGLKLSPPWKQGEGEGLSALAFLEPRTRRSFGEWPPLVTGWRVLWVDLWSIL